MELGTYQSWQPGNEDIYADLCIKWFGCGFSARPDTEEAAEQIRDIEKTLNAGGKVFVKWVCDPQRLVSEKDLFFKQCEWDFDWIARNVPAKRFEIFPEPTCPLVTGRELAIQDYFEVLRIAHDTMKAVDESIQVWNGGIGFFRTMWTLGDFYEMGVPLTDALCLHPFMIGNTWREIATRVSNLLFETQYALAVMQCADKPIVVTEYSAPTEWRDVNSYESYLQRSGVSGLSQEGQAYLYIEVLEQFKAINCPIFCFAALRDSEANTTHWSGHGGFFDPLGGKKLSHDAVSEWAKENERGPQYIDEARRILWSPQLPVNTIIPKSP